MFEQIKAVIFDLDGTLVDSMGIWHDIDIAYLSSIGHSLPDDLQAAVEGKSFHETAAYFKERFSIPDSIEDIKQHWNKMADHTYCNEIEVKKGVPEFLTWCKRMGLKIGIATSNSRHLAEGVLKARNILEYFDVICTSCDVAKGKPEPDVYLEAAKRLHTSPEHCLVFEDIVQGIIAGKSAGMTVCAVEDDYSDYQKQEKKELADYYIHDYIDLLERLQYDL